MSSRLTWFDHDVALADRSAFVTQDVFFSEQQFPEVCSPWFSEADSVFAEAHLSLLWSSSESVQIVQQVPDNHSRLMASCGQGFAWIGKCT